MKPDYGQVSFTSISPGSTAEYSCIRGFQLAGYDRLQCLVTGEWETEPPACQSKGLIHVYSGYIVVKVEQVSMSLSVILQPSHDQ